MLLYNNVAELRQFLGANCPPGERLSERQIQIEWA